MLVIVGKCAAAVNECLNNLGVDGSGSSGFPSLLNQRYQTYP